MFPFTKVPFWVPICDPQPHPKGTLDAPGDLKLLRDILAEEIPCNAWACPMDGPVGAANCHAPAPGAPPGPQNSTLACSATNTPFQSKSIHLIFLGRSYDNTTQARIQELVRQYMRTDNPRCSALCAHGSDRSKIGLKVHVSSGALRQNRMWRRPMILDVSNLKRHNFCQGSVLPAISRLSRVRCQKWHGPAAMHAMHSTMDPTCAQGLHALGNGHITGNQLQRAARSITDFLQLHIRRISECSNCSAALQAACLAAI